MYLLAKLFPLKNPFLKVQCVLNERASYIQSNMIAGLQTIKSVICRYMTVVTYDHWQGKSKNLMKSHCQYNTVRNKSM